jgi:hypothetical protein
MTDIKTRIENAKKVITGNESLLDMLEADAATELLNWGIDLAGRIARSTEGMNDSEAEQMLEVRLKALRQFIRATGNWAAGKYTDPVSRAQLKDKMLEHIRSINAALIKLPSPTDFEKLLGLSGLTQTQAIQKLKILLSISE